MKLLQFLDLNLKEIKDLRSQNRTPKWQFKYRKFVFLLRLVFELTQPFLPMPGCNFIKTSSPALKKYK